jgi:Carboxypeptidase regulatory-like domain
MSDRLIFKHILRRGTALQAIAFLGASIAASALTVAPVSAQDFTNVTASGKIEDAAGKGIGGATVVVTSNAQGFKQTVTTDSSGDYRVPALPQGVYTFDISADGFDAFRDEAVNLTQSSAGNAFRLVRTGATAAAGDIIVTAARIKVSDFDRTTTGGVIEIGELATRVPVARNLTAVVLLTPGTGEGDPAFGNLAAISGASVSENAFFVNGLNITEFREGLGAVGVPFEFYNTVEVKNGGIPAEFGRFTGGFINATTKSGGNQFHGGVQFIFEPNSLRDKSPNTIGGTNLRSGYNQTDKNETKQFIASLSGPIIKDRLFFYGFYQTNDTRTGDTLLTSVPNTVLRPPQVNPVTGLPVTVVTTVKPYSTGLRREERSTNKPFFGGKIDFIPFDGHRFEATYFNSSQVTNIDAFAVVDSTGGGYDSRVDTGAFAGKYNGTTVLQSGGENYVGRYTGQFAKWLTISAAYGKNKNRDIAGSSDDTYPNITDASGNFSPALSGNLLTVIDFNKDTREFYRGDVDVYVNLLGKHHFKAGYDREKLTTDSSSRYTGGVQWAYANSGAAGDVYVPTPNTLYVQGRTFVNGGVFKSLNEAFYIQDSWSVFDNRLSLNFGVRNDRFSNDNVAGKTYYKSGSLWAPRLAFSLDPAGDRRTKIYGSFGRYYLPVVANTNIRLAGAELDYTRYFRVTGINPNNTPILGAPVLGFPDATACPDTGVRNCDIVSDGVATPTESTVSKNLKAQSVDEFVFGIERSLGSRIRVGVFAQYRKLNESLEDVAIDAAVGKYCTANKLNCNSASGSPIWSGFHQYVLVNPGAASRITLSDPINGETTLRTIDFSAADLGYPKARRTYKAVTLTFDREFDKVWGLSASYTWSKSEGNIEGGIRSDNGQTDSGLTTAFDQPGLVNGAYGFLPGDARHRFKIFGSYAPTDWFTIGLQTQASSPRKYGCIGRVPRSVDAFAGAYGAAGFYCNVGADGKVITDPAFPATNTPTSTTLSLTPRGSQFKSDWNMFTNLSLAFRLPAEKFGATFRVDVFNVFNQKNAIDFEERGTQTAGAPRGDYAFPIIYQTPRYFRFQLGFDF